jgi:GDPmannose 4,6-dehydratase
LGWRALLEAIRLIKPDARFYQASSSEMFGKVREVPQSETTPFYPRSPYGVAKVYGHWITVNYRESYKMYCTSGICFNHESPRGDSSSLRARSPTAWRASRRARRASCAWATSIPTRLGFAGDYVEAMWMMMQKPEAEDYVIATGETHSVREFIEVAFAYVNLDWQKHVVIDPKFVRPPRWIC